MEMIKTETCKEPFKNNKILSVPALCIFETKLYVCNNSTYNIN